MTFILSEFRLSMIFKNKNSLQSTQIRLRQSLFILVGLVVFNLGGAFAQDSIEAKPKPVVGTQASSDKQSKDSASTEPKSVLKKESKNPPKVEAKDVPKVENDEDAKVFAIEAIEPIESEEEEAQASSTTQVKDQTSKQDKQSKTSEKKTQVPKEQMALEEPKLKNSSKDSKKLTQGIKKVEPKAKPQLGPNKAKEDASKPQTNLSSKTLAAQQKIKALESPAPPTFVEGELVSVGQIGLLPWDNRFGAQVGLERLGEIYYGTVNVGINHRFDVHGEPLRLTIGVPLRFEILDARPNQRFDNVGRFRQQDWDEASDFAKVIQRLQYGSKEQRFFLDINRFSAHNLGHGLIMKRYDANLNLNTSRVGVQLDAFTDYIGFESMINDITNPNLLGALVFVKPLSLINRSNSILRSFSVGLSLVSDQQAPVRNALDREDLDNDGRRETELQVDQNTFQPDSLRNPVSGYGIDAEIKVVDTRELDIKTYFDMSYLETGLPVGDPESIDPAVVGSTQVRSSGWAMGQLIRSNLGIAPVHALRLRMEYRNYDPNYLPSYFDSLYEIQRFQYLPSGEVVDLANATKLQRVFGRNPNGDRVNGGYFEASWRIGDAFAFAFGLEVNDQTSDNHGFLHLEFPQIGHFQLSTTYHRRNAQNREELFSTKFGNNDIWIFQTRYRTFSWLYNNLSIMTPFGFGPDSVFRSAIQVNLSLEIGFSYGSDDEPKVSEKEKASQANALPAVGKPKKAKPAQAVKVPENKIQDQLDSPSKSADQE